MRASPVFSPEARKQAYQMLTEDIAALFSVRPETINRRIREIRQLLEQAGHTIQPGPHRLASLDGLYSLATAESIVIPSKIKTAC